MRFIYRTRAPAIIILITPGIASNRTVLTWLPLTGKQSRPRAGAFILYWRWRQSAAELVSDFPDIREKYRDFLVFRGLFLKTFRLLIKQTID